MKLVISLLLYSFLSIGCQLNKSYDYIVLSAPVSILMKKLNVLKEVRLISSFHPFDEEILKIGGGIFLRADRIKLKKNSVLFFDESKEFEQNFKKIRTKKEVIKTRNLSAINATKYLINKVVPYLESCSKNVKKLIDELTFLESKIKLFQFKTNHLFYLGKTDKNLKNNSMLIVNDGFMLDFKKNPSFKTYFSNLSYVNWSLKELNKIQEKISIGLTSSKKINVNRLDSGYFNISFPGVFTPGFSQVSFIQFYLNFLTKLEKERGP